MSGGFARSWKRATVSGGVDGWPEPLDQADALWLADVYDAEDFDGGPFEISEIGMLLRALKLLAEAWARA